MGLIQGLLASLFPPMPEPMAEITPGTITTVRGIVVPRDVIESPLTGAPCVYYQFTVEEWLRSQVVGAGDGFWRIADHDEAILEFYVQEGPTRVIVAPQNARVERAKGVPVETIDFGSEDRRGQQLLITRGDEIEITGRVERANDLYDEDRGYRVPPARLMLVAPPGDQIEIRLIKRGNE